MGYKKLAAAIVKTALLDYRRALEEHNEREAKQCERFLRSDWFDMLSESNGEILIHSIKEMVK